MDETTHPWALHNFGDGEREDGLDGYGIVHDHPTDDFGLRIYLRASDPLAHAAEIVAALNAHEARKAEEATNG